MGVTRLLVFAVLSAWLMSTATAGNLEVALAMPSNGWNSSSERSVIQAAVDEINADAGVLPNHVITLTHQALDPGCTADAGVDAGLKLLSDRTIGPEPYIVIGPGCSTSTLAMAPTLGSYKLMMVCPGSGAATLSGSEAFPYFLRTRAPMEALYQAAVALFHHHGWLRKVFIMSSAAHEPSVRLAADIVSGWQGTSRSVTLYTVQHVRAALLEMKAWGSKALISGTYTDEVIKQCAALGMCGAEYVVVVLSSSYLLKAVKVPSARATALGWMTTAYQPPATVDAFRNKFSDRGGVIDAKFTSYASASYDAVAILARGFESAVSTHGDNFFSNAATPVRQKREAIAQALRSVKLDSKAGNYEIEAKEGSNDLVALTYVPFLNIQSDGEPVAFEFTSSRIQSVVGATILWPGGASEAPAPHACEKGTRVGSVPWQCIDCTSPFFTDAQNQDKCSMCYGLVAPSLNECLPCPVIVDGYRHLAASSQACKDGLLDIENIALEEPAYCKEAGESKNDSISDRCNVSLWWNENETSVNQTLFSCPFSNCFFSKVTSDAKMSTLTDLSTYQRWCSAGHKGVLCAECVEGFHLTPNGCSECPQINAVLGDFALILFFIVFFVVVGIAAIGMSWQRRVEGPGSEPGVPITDDQDDLGVEADEPGVDGNQPKAGVNGIKHGTCWHHVKKINAVVGNKVKLVMTYVQILNLFKLEITSIKWPPWMDGLTMFTRYLTIDIFDWTPFECASDATSTAKPFVLKFYLYVYVQLGLIGLVLLFSLGLGRVLLKKKANRLIWNASVFKWLGIVGFLVYTQTTRVIVQALRPCIQGLDVMRADVSVVCYTAEHTSLLIQGVLMFIFFCLGLPGTLMFALYKSKHKLYCYPAQTDVKENGQFVGTDQQELKRHTCGTLLHMHTISAEQISEGIPYTLEKIEQDGSECRLKWKYHFSHGLVMLKTHDDGGEIASAQLALGWLASKYDSNCYWFEPWEFVRKLLITIIAVFAASNQSLQVIYSILVCTVCLVFQTEMQPFTESSDDWLAVVSSTSLAMVLTVGIGLGVPTEDGIAGIMLNGLALALSICVFLVAAFQLYSDFNRIDEAEEGETSRAQADIELLTVAASTVAASTVAASAASTNTSANTSTRHAMAFTDEIVESNKKNPLITGLILQDTLKAMAVPGFDLASKPKLLAVYETGLGVKYAAADGDRLKTFGAFLKSCSDCVVLVNGVGHISCPSAFGDHLFRPVMWTQGDTACEGVNEMNNLNQVLGAMHDKQVVSQQASKQLGLRLKEAGGKHAPPELVAEATAKMKADEEDIALMKLIEKREALRGSAMKGTYRAKMIEGGQSVVLCAEIPFGKSRMPDLEGEKSGVALPDLKFVNIPRSSKGSVNDCPSQIA